MVVTAGGIPHSKGFILAKTGNETNAIESYLDYILNKK
jgi:hypothetical protein